jgi:diguanylate cyclase (GGDEF)-like protein/PAS domain S-box-containing protein
MFRVLNCLTSEHDWRLVLLAAIVCFLASVTAVNLFRRASMTVGRAGLFWLLTAGAATGCGIWATHFIAMLAYDPGPQIGYNIALTALSLIAAMVITSAGMAVAIYYPSRSAAPLGGAIVGGGVASMHYVGMSALELPGHIHWSLQLVFGSILVGMLFASAALAVAFHARSVRGILVAAVLLTVAIVSHHFTAMGAAEVVPDPTHIVSAFALSSTALAIAIANAAVAVLGMSLATAIADRRLREQDRRLAIAVNNMSQGLVMFDAQERMVVCNNQYREMYGLSPDIVKPGCTLLDVIKNRIMTGSLERDAEEYRRTLVDAMKRGETTQWVVEASDGRAISVINKPTGNGDWVATHEDITERRRSEQELKRTKAFLDTVVENVPVTIIVKELPDHRYVLLNRAGERFFGIPREQIIGKTVAEVFSPSTAANIIENDEAVLQSGREIFFDVHPVATPGGETRIARSHRLPMLDEHDKVRYLLGMVEDVTERKRAEARIEHLAHHDPLTNLPNRAALNECLATMLERSAESKESFAVLCIDLDRFKEVNDVFGHSVGDAMLAEVGRRLQQASGGAFVGRIGGDEFIIIAADGEQPAGAEALSDELLACASQEVEIDGHSLRIGLSIGVAIYPGDGQDAAALIANADAALYRAKADGRGTIRFFEHAMDKRLRDRRALQNDLRSAISRDEIELHFQPQARINGEITGFEALVRWHHPVRGLVPPTAFIPLAEESGLIIPMGEWILREACREAVSWPRKLQVAINLSPIQFRHGDLAGLVHSVLLETGIEPGRIELEITEGVLIGDFSRAVSILRRLKALGVRIAMDDFGTGYSSLSYLQAFPFDKIKIDQAFIANLDQNPQSAAIIRAVIGLGHGLELPIVAEGVETRAQLDFLASESCDEVQGYLFGRPGPIGDFAEIVGREDAPKRKAAVG